MDENRHVLNPKASLRRAIGAAMLASAFFVVAPAEAQLGDPKPQAWTRWRQAGPGLEIDQAVWDRFLATYRRVGRDGIARLAYGRVTPRDRAALKAYLRTMSAADVDRMNRAQQFAYWVNLYNAATVDVVLAAYPVSSIRRIDGGLLNTGPWKRKLLTVKGERLSLDDIEHRILRPIWRDPRVHYAINCAALGCPNIPDRAYTAARANSMLDAAARDFINHPRGFRVEGGDLVASSIFDWFAVDFGGRDGVVAHALRYATPATAARLRGKARPDRYTYEWALNDSR
jgi:hypothetical protein